MKKNILRGAVVVVLIMAVCFPGCARGGSSLNGSGNIIDQDIKVSDFNSVNIKGAFDLDISLASEYKVTLSTDDNLIGRVPVSLEHKVLKLSIEAPATFFPFTARYD